MGTDFFQTRGLKPQPERLGGWLRRLPRERGDCRTGPPGLVQPDGRGAFEGLDALHRRATGVSRVGEPVHTDMPSVEDSTTRPSVVGLAARWTRSPRRISVSPDHRPPPRPVQPGARPLPARCRGSKGGRCGERREVNGSPELPGASTRRVEVNERTPDCTSSRQVLGKLKRLGGLGESTGSP
jgi:hypothetical protein